LLRGIGRYRLVEARAFRAKVAAELAGHRGPVLVAANHLTMIDSMIIMWALGSFWTYLTEFRRLPWNMPEMRNFARNPVLRLMCYLGKCIYVERGGSLAARRETLDSFRHVLSLGDWALIFPEGGRSRTGRIDQENATYSVGELYLEVPDVKILCVYLRGEAQTTWGFFPKFGDRFRADARLLTPTTHGEGKRGARDVAREIIRELAAMEEEWLARAKDAATGR
jgi:hypothetical protein